MEKICKNCSKTIHYPKCREKLKKFCSRVCYWEWVSKQKPSGIVICKECRRSFKVYPSRIGKIPYCSPQCHNIAFKKKREISIKNKAKGEHQRKKLYKNQNKCTHCGKTNDRLNRSVCSNCQKLQQIASHKYWVEKVKTNPKLLAEKYSKTRPSLRKYSKKLKLLAMEKYGGKCKCCGEKEILFLTIDHVNNDGAYERKIAKTGYGNGLYKRLLNEPISEKYQILCRNCNWGKHVNGICPHQRT